VRRCPGYPYIGPLPSPARTFAVALVWSTAAFAFLALVQAGLFLQRAHLDQQRADGADASSAITHNSAATHVLAYLMVAGAIVVILLEILWRQQRRPIEALASRGEAYVETPMRQAIPAPLGVAVVVCLVAFGVTLVRGVVPAGAPAASLAAYRWWSAANRVTLAVFWLLALTLVVMTDRHLGRRVARSTDARLDPAGVGYIATLVPRDQRRVEGANRRGGRSVPRSASR
jgi:hypothetical protein